MKIHVPSLIPHGKDMLLVDSVLEVDCTAHYIVTKSIIKPHNAFLEDKKFPVYKSVEIMAQSLGILRGLILKNGGDNKIGFLIATRRFVIHRAFVEIGGEIITCVKSSTQDESGFGVHDCEVFECDKLIASASISTLIPTDEILAKLKEHDEKSIYYG